MTSKEYTITQEFITLLLVIDSDNDLEITIKTPWGVDSVWLNKSEQKDILGWMKQNVIT